MPNSRTEADYSAFFYTFNRTLKVSLQLDEDDKPMFTTRGQWNTYWCRRTSTNIPPTPGIQNYLNKYIFTSTFYVDIRRAVHCDADPPDPPHRASNQDLLTFQASSSSDVHLSFRMGCTAQMNSAPTYWKPIQKGVLCAWFCFIYLFSNEVFQCVVCVHESIV